MLDRLLNYLAGLNLELRTVPPQGTAYKLAAVLLNLTGPEQPDTLDMRLPGMEDYGVWQRVVLRTLRSMDAMATLAAIAAGQLDRCVLPWIPLMHGAADPGIIKEWRRVAEAEPDTRLRTQWAGLALVFADLAGRAAEWKKGLEGWNMGESQVVNEWRAEGRTEGRATGLLEARLADLLHVLEVRFSTAVPSEVKTVIEGSTDPDELSRWLDLALTAKSLEEFRAALRR